MSDIISHARLLERLHYDPETGGFTHLVATKGTRAGVIAGHVRPDGYRTIRLDGRQYYAHRLAMLYVEGAWPPADVDHINGAPGDDRYANLRHATATQNHYNTRGKPGRLKGASFHKASGKWRATIQAEGKQTFLGLFLTAPEAHEAYRLAAARLHGEYGRAA